MRASLPDSAFIVLALIAERDVHGYELQRLVHDRGFRFWTNVKRSSIYNALTLLERLDCIVAHVESAEGPERRVYRITERGLELLRSEATAHLMAPAHPHHELDLGVYALPFIDTEDQEAALRECKEHLKGREAFLLERLAWCKERGLTVPALSFERPLVALQAEIRWVEALADRLAAAQPIPQDQWQQYVYKDPAYRTWHAAGHESRG